MCATQRLVGKSQERHEMKKSRYEELASPELPEKVWNRYGFSETEWAALTVEQREIHYNRLVICEHPYVYRGPFPDDVSETSLRYAYSFDPYAHTAHMFPCRKKDDSKCDCQMCAQQIGIERTRPRERKQTPRSLRDK